MRNKYSNTLALVRVKLLNVIKVIRQESYSFFGMRIGKGAKIGNIKCEWPNKIIIGENTIVEDNVVLKITKPFNDKNTIIIGNNVFIGNGSEFNCNTNIYIGDNVLIASNCTFVDTGHEIDSSMPINKQPLTISPIIIEEDVWIGTRSVILKGVTIGKGSVIGAGSIVNKSIPSFQIWAGTPVRYIKDRK